MPTQRGFRRLLTVAALVGALAAPLPGPPAQAESQVADGFADVVAISGLSYPTAVAFAGDGRVFVAERSGLIKVFDSLTDPTATIAADLRTQTHNFWDRGLLGIALDPDFPTRPYLYALYTYDTEPGGTAPRWGTAGAASDGCPDPPGATTDGCVVQARLVRITLAGDVSTGPERVLVTGWCQQYPSHSIGTVAFGPDGALYASAGDGASFLYPDWGQRGNPCADPPGPGGASLSPPTAEGGALRAQSVRRPAGQPAVLSGTVVRVDPDTGAGLADNPFADSADPNARRIIAYGLRNPFRFGTRPGTDQLWVGDVGWAAWDEIDRIAHVADGVAENFGWPCYEGAARQPGYDTADLTRCESLYSGPGQTPPYYAYYHDAKVVDTDGCAPGSTAVTGIAFEHGSNYPADYAGALFFADAARGCIWAMQRGGGTDPNPALISPLVEGAGMPVQLTVGPGGDLFWVNLDPGELHRLVYVGANHLPTATIEARPTSGPAPLSVSFDGTGSTDLDGDPLRYAWDLDGDGEYDDSTVAAPTYTYPANRSVTVRLRVTDPGGASGTRSVWIDVGPPNHPPAPVIDTPASTLRWRAGEQVAFSGRATDAEDGTLSADRLSWSLLLQHCPSNCHAHPVQDLPGMASGSIPAPDHEYPAYLVLTLTATDADGVSASTSVRLDPETVELTLTSEPSGLQLSLFSSTVTTPATRTVIVGSTNGVGAPSPQQLGGTTYQFVSWSDGGPAAHTVEAPERPSTYTATYRAAPAGLVAAYSFDQGAGTNAPDATGAGHTGLLSSGTSWTSAGRFGGALTFDGRTGMVTVPDTADLRLSGAMTLEAWVRPATVTGRRTVLLKERSGGLVYGLYAGSSSRRPQGAAYLGGAERTATAPDPLPLNAWSHLALTYDGSALRIYVNGVRVTSHASTGTMPALTGALRIGANAVWGERFTGRIDEVRIYRRALTGAEIAADRNRPVP